MSAKALTYDLADKLMDGVFELGKSSGKVSKVETFTLMGAELTAHQAAFTYETYRHDYEVSDRDEALVQYASKVRISPNGLKNWMISQDFSEWSEFRGMPQLLLDPDKNQISTKTRSLPPKLTTKNAKRGGSQPKFNRGLQTAINRIAEDLQAKGQRLTTASILRWLQEQTRRGRDPNDEPERYSFDPEIPDCDDLQIDGGKLYWKDRQGRERDISLRSLEPYVRRTKDV